MEFGFQTAVQLKVSKALGENIVRFLTAILDQTADGKI